MPFPEASSRYVYTKNPLKKVICQFRFPPILRIDTEIPSKFQERIRDGFPMYKSASSFQQEQFLNLNQSIPSDLINITPNKNYEFSSVDGIWKINLTRTFLSLSTSKYFKWEEFFAKLLPTIDALIAEYNPPFFTRIGLRYVDIIDRNELQLQNCEWANLLQPHIIGLYATDIQANIRHFENIQELILSDGTSRVRILSSIVKNISNSEECFSIDSDFYYPNRCNLIEIKDKLDYLHSRSTNLLQWIITEKLHNAMEPKSINE